jgi:ribonuclease Z
MQHRWGFRALLTNVVRNLFVRIRVQFKVILDSWILGAALASLAGCAVTASEDAEATIRVILLGTGTPAIRAARMGPSVLVQAGTSTLLFDAGRGTALRLQQAGVDFANVNKIFLTHLHSDHLIGLDDVWLSRWLLGRQITPLEIWGPTGVQSLMDSLNEAFRYDIHIRSSHLLELPLKGAETSVIEIEEGLVYNGNGVTVRAFEVDHSPIEPAYGYRIDYAGHSVGLSGDTIYSDNLVRHLQGVDLLVHEVAFADEEESRNDFQRSVVATHTSPRAAGRVFQATQPILAVYTHVITFDSSNDERLVSETTPTYSGAVVVGEDLMVIEVGDDVRVIGKNSYE